MRGTRSFAVIASILLSACGGDDGGGLSASDGGPAGRPIDFVTPTANSWIMRDQLDEDGRLVAVTDVIITAHRDEVAAVELSISGGASLGTLTPPSLQTTVSFRRDEVVELVAVAYDGAGAELGSAITRVNVGQAQKTCAEWMELFDITYTAGPDLEGVPDPITVTPPIAGIDYRYYYDESPRTEFDMDCSTARALAMMGPYLSERGVVKIVDIGVYDYRCIGGGTPPDCPSGLSQHALARALDIHELETSDGTTYNVETDWVIDIGNGDTCAAATENAKDAWLHELICELYDDGVWSIALTPNYNAAHRNHFHVDLTAGGRLMRRRAGVDIEP